MEIPSLFSAEKVSLVAVVTCMYATDRCVPPLLMFVGATR